MKKLICLLMVLLLCMGAAAMAEEAPLALTDSVMDDARMPADASAICGDKITFG